MAWGGEIDELEWPCREGRKRMNISRVPKDKSVLLNQLLDIQFPTLKQMELWLIWSALCRTDFIQKDAAKLLGISQRTMCYKMKSASRIWRDLFKDED